MLTSPQPHVRPSLSAIENGRAETPAERVIVDEVLRLIAKAIAADFLRQLDSDGRVPSGNPPSTQPFPEHGSEHGPAGGAQ